MNDNKSGTIFTLAGKIWGYDITLFNYFGENEILLEPERKFYVEEVMPPINGVIHIRWIYKDTPLVLPVLFNNNYIINDYKSMDPHKFQKTYLKAKALVDEQENNISKEKIIYTFKGDGTMDPHKIQKTYLKAKALVDEQENNISKEKAIYTFKGDGTMDPHKIQKTYLNFKWIQTKNNIYFRF